MLSLLAKDLKIGEDINRGLVSVMGKS